MNQIGLEDLKKDPNPFFVKGAVPEGHQMQIKKELSLIGGRGTDLFSSVMFPSNSIQDVVMDRPIATGSSGQVWLGDWHGSPVALKEIIKGDIDIAQEATTLKAVKSPRIVAFYGIYQNPEKKNFIVTEFVAGGSLKDFLKQLKRDQKYLLLPDAWRVLTQVASGMKFLTEDKKIYHRDLAARNILINWENGILNIKIADFGLSSPTFEMGDHSVPIRWLAPEVFETRQYHHTSDVYSYGCTLYELMSLGDDPWPGMTLEEVKTAVMSHQKPVPPENCPELFSDIMHMCWFDKASRPSFADLFIFLKWHNQILAAKGSNISTQSSLSSPQLGQYQTLRTSSTSTSTIHSSSDSAPGVHTSFEQDNGSPRTSQDGAYVFISPV
eukprot:TRINITY_DN5116_c1_g1_i1.p1 TRINITY_DN5116_c1_g1~~TRINITY_DN5116_c1_g1_i1.p1  ORF type:complete len:441 (+),score=103.83 TRINITY_DN5116_c1_g1_i1:179-1324(+)